MKKRPIVWVLTIALLASFGFGACGCGKKKLPAPPQAQPQPAPQAPAPIQGKALVEKLTQQYPELLWLASADVRKTEEGQAAVDKPYSEQLFGKKFIEFDRSVMALHCLKLILDGSDKSYDEFTAAQPAAAKLSRDSFRVLHEQGLAVIKSRYLGMSAAEITAALETALVLGDMGKSEKARTIFKSYGATAPDHDDFYGEAMKVLQKQPRLANSYARLTSRGKRLLNTVANLAHYGHITHLEGGPAMFAQLKQSKIASSDPKALAFDLFVHTCDVMGALGHLNNSSSLVYTEPTHRGMQAMAASCCVLSDSTKTEADAYEAYLAQRAAWLGLNAAQPDDRVLARIGAMLRLFTPEEGAQLKEAMQQISEQDRMRIAVQFNPAQQTGRTPTYMPTVLVNLFNNQTLGAAPQERLSKAVVYGLPFLAKVLEKQKQRLEQGQANPDVPLNFNTIAGVAKTAPRQLAEKDFTIDAEGMVALK
jgi:hypothetical protein